MGTVVARCCATPAAQTPWLLLSDSDLITQARTRDPAALAALFDRFHDSAVGFAYLYLRNHHDAEDAVQTAWVRVVTSLDQFRGTGKFSTWLCTIVLNECRQIHKRSRTSRKTSLDAEMEAGHWRKLRAAIAPVQIEAEQESTQMQQWLRRNIRLLPVTYRRILLMRYVHELPLRQVAAALKLSEPAAKSRIMRARAELQARLQSSNRGRIRGRVIH